MCDEQHNPTGQFLPLYGHHHSSKMIKNQTEWNENSQKSVWTKIVSRKIYEQAKHLSDLKKAEAELLFLYLNELKFDDSTNREGHSAKVYFNALFGKEFTRENDSYINAALDYGYSVLLSLFNKEITASGYVTQLGIKHKNEFNDFNLSCDLMEPFRIIVDRYIVQRYPFVFDAEFKYDLLNLFNRTFNYGDGNYYLSVIISMYVKSVLKAIESGKPDSISFLEL